MSITITRHCDDCSTLITNFCWTLYESDVVHEQNGTVGFEGPWHFCTTKCLKQWLVQH